MAADSYMFVNYTCRPVFGDLNHFILARSRERIHRMCQFLYKETSNRHTEPTFQLDEKLSEPSLSDSVTSLDYSYYDDSRLDHYMQALTAHSMYTHAPREMMAN